LAYSNGPERLRHVCSTDPAYSAPPDLAGFGGRSGEKRGREGGEKGRGREGRESEGEVNRRTKILVTALSPSTRIIYSCKTKIIAFLT